MNLRRLYNLGACCALPLLAAFLGGSTQRWAQGIILLLLAVVVAIDPPRTFVSRGLLSSSAILLALGATAFLPAGWFGEPPWMRSPVLQEIPFAPTWSPQPWISGECLVLLLAGLLWIFWLASREWEPGDRKLALECFVTGAAILAAIAIGAFCFRLPVPFWHSERGFGPFPNRNQTGNFFALGGILAVACAYARFRGGSNKGFWFAACACVLAWALVLSYSRAAIILFFAGAALWVAALGCVSRSVKPVAVGASALMIMGAVFLLFGGATLQRFMGPEKVTSAFRLLIYKDVFSLLHASPWCGIGLGNFEAVFALFRKASVNASRILHPESDWLWLASELGWFAVAAVLAGAGSLLPRVAPLQRGTDRQLRLAALSAAIIFAVHGLVDVPGHRLGSMLPGLFVLAMALNNSAAPRAVRFAPWCFRIAAVVVGLTGAFWFWCSVHEIALPGEVGVRLLKDRARAMYATGVDDPVPAIGAATRALEWAPLEWELYFLRGAAEVRAGNWPRAFDDFRRVNALETTSPLVTMQEGNIWAGSNQPSLALDAWAQTLRRVPPEEAAPTYANMLGAVTGNPRMRAAMHALARGRFDMEIRYMTDAPQPELDACIRSLLRKDPGLKSLTDPQKSAFFRLWQLSSDPGALEQLLEANPAWQPLAWRQVATARAARGDLKGACRTVFDFMPAPQLPSVPAPAPGIDALNQRIVEHPDDYLSGYALYAALRDQKNDAMALQITRGFTSRAECPKYFFYLEAQAAFQTGDYTAAWAMLQKYTPISN